MPKFDLKIIDSIRGKQVFYQLTVDDNPDSEGILEEAMKNDKKTGILDQYEKSLEKKYKKDMVQIYNTMQRVANNEHVPGEKYHECTGRDKSDPYKDYEFKHGDLRVYAIKTHDGKIIVLAGYKNTQKSNILRMRSIKKQYFESLKNKE